MPKASADNTASPVFSEGDSIANDYRPQEEAPPEPSETAPGTAISCALPAASSPRDDKFETMVEAVLPCTTAQVCHALAVCTVLLDDVGGLCWVTPIVSVVFDNELPAVSGAKLYLSLIRVGADLSLVRQVFAWVWGRGTNFWEDFLCAQGEAGLQITPWRKAAVAAEAGRRLDDLFPGETFDEQRELTFTHPRTGFVVGACHFDTAVSRAKRKHSWSLHSPRVYVALEPS